MIKFSIIFIKIGFLYFLSAFQKDTLISANFEIYYGMPNEIPAIYQNENLLDSFLFKNKYDCFRYVI